MKQDSCEPPPEKNNPVHKQRSSAESANPGEDVSPPTVVVPPSPQSPESPPDKDETRECRAEHRDRIRLGVEISAVIVGLVGIGGLFVTFLETQKSTRAATRAAVAAEQAAIATADQVKVAQDTLKLTTESSRLDQRPWIFVVDAPSRVGDLMSIEYSMKVVNNGRTPAYIFETSHACKTGPLPEIPQYRPTPEGMIIPPGPVFTATPKFDVIIPENLITDVRMGKRPFYCYGYYKYRDWWGEEHVTGYTFKLNRITLGFSFDSTPGYIYAK